MPQPSETFYTIDSTKLGYGEYWRFSNGRWLAFTVCALKKLFGSPMDLHTAIPRFEQITRLDIAQFSADMMPELAKGLERCRQLNLTFQFYYTIPNIMMQISYGAVLLSADCRTVAQFLVVRSLRGAGKITLTFNCCSKLKDNRLLATLDQPKKMNSPSYSIPEHIPSATPDMVLKRHIERLNKMGGTGAVTLSPDTLEVFILELNLRAIDAKIAAGVYVPLDPAKAEQMRSERANALNALKR